MDKERAKEFIYYDDDNNIILHIKGCTDTN